MKNHFLRLALLALTAVLALALSACGSDEEESSADLGPDPATMVPADAPVYLEAVVRPEGDMASNLDAALSKVLVTDDPGAKLHAAIDEALAEEGDLTYSEDIEPWLGQRVGGFLSGYDPKQEHVDGAAAVAVTDAAAAQAFVDELAKTSPGKVTTEDYEGISFTVDAKDDSWVGIDGDFLLAGNEQAVQAAVDAGAGESLADRDAAETGLDEVPEDRLFAVYVDADATLDMVEESGGLEAAQLKQFREQLAEYGDGPFDAWGTVTADAFTISGSGPAPADAAEPSELVSGFPSEAWLAFAGPDIGRQLDASLGQLGSGLSPDLEDSVPPGFGADFNPADAIEQATGIDLEKDLSWIGDVGGFVQGTSLIGLGGGVVLEATDEKAASDTVGKLRTALEKGSGTQVSPSESGDGFKVQPAGSPLGAEVALQDGKVVIAAGSTTVDSVLSPSETLGDADRFKAAQEALGGDLTPSFFLDFAPVLELVKSAAQVTSDPSVQQATPYLSALDYLIMGTQISGEESTASMVLGVKESSDSGEEAASAMIAP